MTAAEPQIGDTVTIDSPGHLMHGRTGVVEYTKSMLGTTGVSIKGDRYGFLPNEVVPARTAAPDPCHECRCPISPPCFACVECRHWDHPDCSNDCQDCPDHEEP